MLVIHSHDGNNRAVRAVLSGKGSSLWTYILWVSRVDCLLVVGVTCVSGLGAICWVVKVMNVYVVERSGAGFAGGVCMHATHCVWGPYSDTRWRR